MEELLAALIGIVAGAVATGAVQTWQQSRERRVAAKVAARLILGDLFLAEHTVDRIIEGGRWPDVNMPTFERELDVWGTNRLALAAAVDATDWMVVAGAYQDLADLPGVAEASQPLTEEEQRVLGEIRKRLGAASTVVAEYAAPERERERVMKTLGTRSSGG